VRDDEKLLTDADLLAMGHRRVHGPTPDPFAGGIEGDTFYDKRTGERYPDDDGKQCSCCDEEFVQQRRDIVVVEERDTGDDESPGLYLPSTSAWAYGNGVWMAPLPHEMIVLFEEAGYGA
jgi:hypothetical protein